MRGFLVATLTKEKIVTHSLEGLDDKEALTGIYEDECTWLAETLNGSMRTSFNFELIDGQLFSREKDETGKIKYRSLRRMYQEGAEYAKNRTAIDPRVAFEIEREKKHLEELSVMEKMAAGQAPNTTIVVSPFPESLENELEEDIQGYKPKLKRSMLRIITANEDGVINVMTQSLDNTKREALLAIYKEMDWPIDEGIDSERMLSERMHFELSKDEQKALRDQLVSAYDAKLAEQKGGEWSAGRMLSEDDNGDTWRFVVDQNDVLEKHFDAVVPILQRLRNYNRLEDEERLGAIRFMTAATMRDRYEGKVVCTEGGLEGEMSAAADSAAEKGEEFGGCGLTIAGQKEDVMQKMGYRMEDSLKCVTCPFCGSIVDARLTKNGIQCPACNKERLNSGKIVNHNSSQSSSSEIHPVKTLWESLGHKESIKPSYTVREKLMIGGTETTIEDRQGNIIAMGKEAVKIKKSL